MILITKTNVYINMPNITTLGITEDGLNLIVNMQPIVFDTKEECLEIFNKIVNYLTNVSMHGVEDLREND